MALGWRPNGAAGAALVTRERVDAGAEVALSGYTGLSRPHTSRYIDDSGCRLIIVFTFVCTILLFIMLLPFWCWLNANT